MAVGSPKETKELDEKSRADKIVTYGTGAEAIEILDQVQSGTLSVSVPEGTRIILAENEKTPPKLLNIILSIAKNSTELPWKATDGKQEKDAVVAIGDQVYQVNIEKIGEGENDYRVNIRKQAIVSADGNIVMAETPVLSTHLTLGATAADVRVEGQPIRNTRLGPVQAAAVKKIGAKLQEDAKKPGEPQKGALAVLGTGSGKSFVMAGITEAIGEGVYVVPDHTLATEMKGEIEKLQGQMGPTPQVFVNPSVKELEELLKDPVGKHIVLEARDKDFAQKAAMIKGKVVLIDESHQHTYKKKDLQVLKNLAANNSVVALTGTPTSSLREVFGNSVENVNILEVMKMGRMRFIHGSSEKIAAPKETRSLLLSSKIPRAAGTAQSINDAVVHKMQLRYYGGEGYLTKESGKESGYKDPATFLTNKENPTEADIQQAIDKAVKQNIRRISDRKNFIFSGDAENRKKLIDMHREIFSGTGNKAKLAQFQKEVAKLRQAEEIEARIKMWHQLDPVLSKLTVEKEKLETELKSARERKDDGSEYKITAALRQKSREITKRENEIHLRKRVQESVPLPKVDLKAEAELAQKKQIANALNTKILKLLYTSNPPSPKDPSDVDFEIMQRLGTLEKYLRDHPLPARDEKALTALKAVYDSFVKKFPDALPASQREKLLGLINSKVQLGAKGTISLINPEEINLAALGATYAVDAPAREQPADKQGAADKESLQIIEQLKLGLVMHVGSDERYATGISIPSVLSVQQMITREDDPLINAQLSVQLFGRIVRARDDIGTAMQVVSDLVPNSLYLTPLDLVTEQATELALAVDARQEEYFVNFTLMSMDSNPIFQDLVDAVVARVAAGEAQIPVVVKNADGDAFICWKQNAGDKDIHVKPLKPEDVKSFTFPNAGEEPVIKVSCMRGTACPKPEEGDYHRIYRILEGERHQLRKTPVAGVIPSEPALETVEKPRIRRE